MTNPIEVKGKDGMFRALRPYGRRAGAVRHKNQDELDKGIFVGREGEMIILRAGLKSMLEEKKGGAYILEGLAGMGKSAIVWQLQRESIDQNVRFLISRCSQKSFKKAIQVSPTDQLKVKLSAVINFIT